MGTARVETQIETDSTEIAQVIHKGHDSYTNIILDAGSCSRGRGTQGSAIVAGRKTRWTVVFLLNRFQMD